MSPVKFRPCIDLRNGRVVQIRGGTLESPEGPVTNFEAENPAAFYADLYKQDALKGGHVILLGPGNEEQALAALAAYPGGFHVGGGISPSNAERYLEAGASHVIVTSYIFSGSRFDTEKLQTMVKAVGRERLILDLSCRRKGENYHVVTDRWQTFTELVVTPSILADLSNSCSEFLVHGVDVEGTRLGIEEPLVELLAHSALQATYAGGARALEDLDRVNELGRGRVDLTIGSALDIFGGDVPYRDVVAWHRRNCA